MSEQEPTISPNLYCTSILHSVKNQHINMLAYVISGNFNCVIQIIKVLLLSPLSCI